MADQLFNVVAVNIKTGARRLLDVAKTQANADAIISFAVMRRGVEEEFYTTEPSNEDQCRIAHARAALVDFTQTAEKRCTKAIAALEAKPS